MIDTTHDIDALVKTANAITRHPSMGGAMAHAQDVLSGMSDALISLQAERDTWKARAEAAEAALIHEVKRSRRHLARSTLEMVDALTPPSDLTKGLADE